MATTLDGTNLVDPAGRWTLSADSRVRVPAPFAITDVSIPGHHGVLAALRTTASPGSAVLAFSVAGADYDALLANYNSLARLVGPRNRLRTLIDGDYRASVQYVSSTEFEVVAGDTDGTVTFTLSIPSGFWRDAAVASVDLGSSSGLKSPAALQGGTAPIVDPAFVVASSGGQVDVTVTDTETGAWLTFDGPVPGGHSVRISPATATAYVADSDDPWSGGDAASGYLTLGPGQFQLSADLEFRVTHDGSGGGVQMRARRAYL